MRRLMVALVALAFSVGWGCTLAAERETPATGTFSPAGSLAEARGAHTATLLPDGRVLVVGGVGGDYAQLASAEVWGPATGAFSPAASLAEARHYHTATLLPDGRVLVVGGFGEEADPLASVEVWDPTTGVLSPTGSPAEGRSEHTVAPTATPVAEAESPSAVAFSPAGSLAEARSWHTATLLPNGRVLVVGGDRKSTRLNSSHHG